MRGYKGFDKDLKCRDFQYEVGKEYEIKEKIEICNIGFHFCQRLIDVMDFYDTHNNNRFCEVEATGRIIADDENKKYCTNKIKIIKEIPIEEVLEIVNTGDCNTGDYNTGNCNTGNYNTGNYNTGYRNTGDYNTGDCNTGNYNTGDYNTGDYNTGDYNTGYRNTGNYNTGDCNTGYRNTGDYNTGNYNTGDYNTGYRNTGDYNTGDCNTGDCNTGDCNTGDCNTGNYNTGMFNTDEPKARLFNKECNLKMSEIDRCRINYILSFINKTNKKLVWKYTDEMTAEEKEEYPEYTTTGGALILEEVKIDVQKEWEQVEEEDKKFIMTLPNFDADIFYKCTGIRV